MSLEVVELVKRYLPNFPLRYCRNIITDTTQFMSIDYGDVIKLDCGHYMVYKNEAERRFGLEDPKYWVKRCIELETGTRKILKLEFHETFPVKIGQFKIDCYRSPDKESRILEIVDGDPRFMQGKTVCDAAGRNVRILDIVQGRRLDLTIDSLDMEHETYFRQVLPGLLRHYIDAIYAIGKLHHHGERHGDIRRDHLYIDYKSNRWCWIDFDYTFKFYEHPFGLDLFGLGNILVFLVGMASITVQSLQKMEFEDGKRPHITQNDLSVAIGNRIINLQKIYPYIPDELNQILMHFSAGAEVFYSMTDELLEDLIPCVEMMEAEMPARPEQYDGGNYE